MQLNISLKKTFRPLLLSLAVMAAAAACTDEVPDVPADDTPMEKAGYITVRLSSSTAQKSRVEADVDALHENLISSATLCLFPSAAASDADRPVFVETFTGIDKSTTHTLEVKLAQELRDRLFPDGATQCQAYVVANLPATSAQPTETMTLGEIRAISVTSDFASSAVQPSFVMDGSTDAITLVNAGDRNESASGEINLQRAASKITLAVKVADIVEVRDENGNVVETWRPQPGNMSVLVANGVSSSAVTPSTHTLADGDYYSTATGASEATHRQRPLGDAGETAEYRYVLQSPFYTYPNRWTNDDNERMTYMTLMVPWRKDGEDTYRTCYYMVPVTQGVTEIARNVSYRVNLSVNILGSFTPDEPLELDELSYTAVDWGSVGTDLGIADFRYLVVDQDRYVLNNLTSTSIPVYTSHPTVVTNVVMTYYRYGVTAAGNEYPVNITMAQNEESAKENRGGSHVYTCTFQNADATHASSSLEFSHPLVLREPYRQRAYIGDYVVVSQSQLPDYINNIVYYGAPTGEAAYSRYDIEITIAHQNRPDISQTIHITQYPQMYIEATQNYSTPGASAAAGNLWVNGHQARRYGDGNSEAWYVTYGLSSSSSTNSNPNQYVISITQLDNGTDYVIGDPRSREINNLPFDYTRNPAAPASAWEDAPDMNGTERRLSYYYPTESSTEKANWIAPKFRIASSYGVCFPNSYTENQRRCASYQEMGYPAGRWRIPTVAEIEFIMNLSNEGKIPSLFNSGSNYMSAQGVITATLTNGKLTVPTNTGGSSAVRCVYDEWYWDDVITPGADGKYPFTWGDREKSSSQPTAVRRR